MVRVPILTYHAAIISSTEYFGNDHVALASDLALIKRMGWRIISFRRLVQLHQSGNLDQAARCVVLTCDDGTTLDVQDVDFPGFGHQRSFKSILEDARSRGEDDVHMTTFVIADDRSRNEMDAGCLFGKGWMHADWWVEAAASGLFEIGCHSWDHNHNVLSAPAPDGMERGGFAQVNNKVRADYEISQAVQEINLRISPRKCEYFCFPYGETNSYLLYEYLPKFGGQMGLKAAVGVQGEPVTLMSSVWHLPRYVCGWHWKSESDLAEILRSCERVIG